MDTFFTYEDNLPAGSGYELFSITHISLVMLCLIILISIVIYYKKTKKDRHRKVIRIITSSLPVMLTVLRWIFVKNCGGSLLYELPLHLCSMTGFLCCIFEFTSGRRSYIRSVLGQSMYALCLPGAILAILFPNGTYYPVLHFITIESYLFHILIITYMVLELIDGNIGPDITESYKSIVFLLIIIPPVMIFDHIFGTNYMFLNGPSHGSPLMIFYTAGGYGGYLIGYAIVALVVILLMNSFSYLKYRHK